MDDHSAYRKTTGGVRKIPNSEWMPEVMEETETLRDMVFVMREEITEIKEALFHILKQITK